MISLTQSQGVRVNNFLRKNIKGEVEEAILKVGIKVELSWEGLMSREKKIITND